MTHEEQARWRGGDTSEKTAVPGEVLVFLTAMTTDRQADRTTGMFCPRAYHIMEHHVIAVEDAVGGSEGDGKQGEEAVDDGGGDH